MMQKLLFLGGMLLALLTGNAVYAYDFKVDDICYTVTSFENYTVTVDGFNNLSGIIEIPSNITYNNRNFTVTSVRSVASEGDNIVSVLLPASITEIEEGAFAQSSITHIEIPDNVTNIGYGAFENCIKLHTVKISKNVKKLDSYLFAGCASLTKIDWQPEGYGGSIKGGAFKNCKSLKTFRIPSGVESLGGTKDRTHVPVFTGCTALDSLIIEDGESAPLELEYNDGRIGDGTYFGEFHRCKINYIYLGRAIKERWENKPDPELYYVEHLEIGNNVKELPLWPPNGQGRMDRKQLKTLVIGSSLTKVMDFSKDPFYTVEYGNQTLEFIKIKGNTPPKAEGFSNYNFINTILYVPQGAKAIYESTEIWKNFWNIQEFPNEESDISSIKIANNIFIQSQNGILYITGISDRTTAFVYSVSGQLIGSGIAYQGKSSIATSLNKGDIAIVRIGNIVEKIIME
jgi:hypothetical protein